MIRFAVVGYGNLGKACERIAYESEDFEMVGIFTRRDPATMKSPFGTSFYKQDEIINFKDKVDVLALCTGSANDLTSLGLSLANNFNTVDSFDTHAKMCEYVTGMDKIAKASGHLNFIGIGWDPGLFSLMRTTFLGVLKDGNTQTFWGKGVSQGHSEAVRKLKGVINAVQYTIPKEEAVEKARNGEGASLTTRDKHLRECFVVAEEGADLERIEHEIKTMPNYFADYDTIVHFIDEEEFNRDHKGMPHGGFVLRAGKVNGFNSTLEFDLTLESNPNFTSNVLMNYVRANYKMYNEGYTGAKTVADIPVSMLYQGTREEMLNSII